MPNIYPLPTDHDAKLMRDPGPQGHAQGRSVGRMEYREQRGGSDVAVDPSARCKRYRVDTQLRIQCKMDDLITIVVVLLYSAKDCSRIWREQ